MKTSFPANSPADFGDHVRIRSTPETESLGLAGLDGQVFGQTTPSITRVEVIGELTQDYAINVHFKEKKAGYWFAAELIEFLDHSPGTEINVKGIPDSKMIRTPHGRWEKVGSKRPWWKFWC